MTLIITDRATGAIIASGRENDTALELEGNWYFAPEAVNMDYLVITDRTYVCPYKGMCCWIDLVSNGHHTRNVAWVYQDPKPGYEFIKDRIGFYARSTSGTAAARVADETG